MRITKKMEVYLAPVGRILMGVFFILAGLGKITDFEATVQYISSAGFDGAIGLAIFAIVTEMLGGAAILTGFYGRQAALVVACFVLIITIPFHGTHTWNDPLQQAHFMKNLAIIGALLFMAAHIGKAAVDAAHLERRPIS